MLKVFLSILFIWTTITMSYGQATRIYDHRDYGFGELSSNLINSIAQDRHGYIWIATEYGLNKFDGVRFIQYLHDVQDSTSISSNHVTILHRDNQDYLWIGCSNGLQYYDQHTEQFVRIQFPDQIAPHITDILTRADGSLLVTTSGWGIYAIDVNQRVASSLEQVNQLVKGMYGRKLLEDNEKNLWIAIDRTGVTCLSPDLTYSRKISKAQIPFPKGGKYHMAKTSSGEVILAYGSQAVLFDPASNRYTPLLFETDRNKTISDIRVVDNKDVLFSTEGAGMWYLELATQQYILRQAELPNLDKSYSQARIQTFLQDREKNLWLGWFQRGLVFIPATSKQFSFWRVLELDELDKDQINAITTDHNKHTWYSVDGNGVFMADSNGHLLRRYGDLRNVTKLIVDKNENIWFTSYLDGLGKINTKDGDAQYLGVLEGKETNTLAIGKNGKLYVSTFGSGFVEFDVEKQSYRHFSMNNNTASVGQLGNDWIHTILCDQKGLIWLGHHKGISCYDPQNNTFVGEEVNKELSEQIVLSLLQDRHGNIWVGTYNGLHKIEKDTRKISSYTTNNGLSSNVISGLGEDKDGNIWCSTFNGINYVNPVNNKVVTYYTGDGLVDRSYNRSVYHQSSDGKIYFGGKQGITSFYPQQVRLSKYPNPVYITNLYIRNQTIKPGYLSGKKPIFTESLATASEFYFANQDDSFTLELSTMDFNSPENIHYEYRLKGFNKTWNTNLPGVNLITYNNLSPGDHELEIRACKFGAYSESKTITLHVMPPWYRSTLAYLVYMALVIGIIILIANYLRERRLEKLHAYKLQLFTDISHEIRSPLTLVLSPIDKLIKNTSDVSSKETLQNMRKNAHRILNLVNQLLDIRKLESGQLQLKFAETNLADFVKQCAQSFEQQARERNIDFRVNSDSTYIPVWVDTNSIDKVINNLLSNAFKYTPDNGSIEINITSISHKQLSKQQNYAEITVTDTGPGVPEGEDHHIFKRFYQGNNQVAGGQQGSGIGLHLTEVLIKKHGGKISVENRTDKRGCSFCVQIPMGATHLPKAQIEKVPIEKDKMDPSILAVPSTQVETESVTNKIMHHKTNFKVLVVDDEKDILRYVSQELQNIYKIISAENGSEAFQLALSQLPDLIISDVSMPDMNGFELVKKIKSNSTTNHIPIILLTAKITQEDRMQGIGLGADAYLTKPFLIDELLITAENLIKNRMTVKGKYSGAQDQEGKVKTISFKSSDEILMERIVKIINDYLENPSLNVQLLADEVGLSRVQLHRKVKALTGISTSEFIRNIRLKQAEKLLLDKQMNISQVAYALGFTNQTHFSTLFKKMYGLSPSEYINRHANQHS
ncbi:hybrid sensor histidine kinase/response regulator transcription factor [Sphingobacterium corticibacterium]|uniref:histidine kinase n=1 Tax=Sphingobacterium corticibacterium TaxID=2484746 RepID=A0A4Q6XPI9_9SPHI|nr:hybrid sensor histidine kinase/response regulator transcription factor [Sphingobacterium corticibacterium]RZF59312.1 hybrid sensor histidine kinase/response regulator [Sphingobacterium corticibacterium]